MFHFLLKNQVAELDTLNQQLESSNNNNLIMSEQQNLLRERLADEERKNFQFQQYIQQLQQQKNTLMNQIAVSTSNSSNLSNKQSTANQNNVVFLLKVYL